MHFLTRSETYKPRVVVSGSGTDLDNVRDTDVTTSSTDTSPVASSYVVFDFQSSVTIDSFWIRVANLTSFDVFANTSPRLLGRVQIGRYQAGSNQVAHHFDFAPYTARYFGVVGVTRPVTPSPIQVFELLFMRHLLTIDNVNDQPTTIDPVRKDRGGNSYQLADGTLVSYEGLTRRGKMDITIGWEQLRRQMVDQLESLWLGPPKQQILTVYPEPVEYPSGIYQMWWRDNFDFNYQGDWVGQGLTGEMKLEEV